MDNFRRSFQVVHGFDRIPKERVVSPVNEINVIPATIIKNSSYPIVSQMVDINSMFANYKWANILLKKKQAMRSKLSTKNVPIVFKTVAEAKRSVSASRLGCRLVCSNLFHCIFLHLRFLNCNLKWLIANRLYKIHGDC